MEPVFNKTFFKFLFGFIFIILFGLLGIVLSNRFLQDGPSVFADTNAAK